MYAFEDAGCGSRQSVPGMKTAGMSTYDGLQPLNLAVAPSNSSCGAAQAVYVHPMKHADYAKLASLLLPMHSSYSNAAMQQCFCTSCLVQVSCVYAPRSCSVMLVNCQFVCVFQAWKALRCQRLLQVSMGRRQQPQVVAVLIQPHQVCATQQ